MNTVLHRIVHRLPWIATPTPAAWDEDAHASLCRTVTAILFVVSGLVQWLILLAPDSGPVNERGLALVGLSAVGAGAAATLLPARLFTGLHGFLIVIPVAITLAGLRRYFAGPSTEHYAIFHIITFVWLGIACRRGAGVLAAPFLVASFVIPLVLNGNVTSANIGSLLAMVPVCVLLSETLAWMVIRLRSAAFELQRREAQTAVDRAESRYLALIEQLPSVTYVYKENRNDPERSRDEYISPQIFGLLGVTQEEWLNTPGLWSKYIHPDDLDDFLAVDAATTLTGEPFDHEYRMVRPDGRVVWILETARRVDVPDQNEITWIGEYYDITKLHEAEASLRETDSRYRTLLEQVPLVIYMEEINIGDSVLPCLYVSPQISTLVGYEPAEWREQFRWEHCLHFEDKAWVMERWAQANATRGAFAADYRLVAKDGRIVWVHDEAQVVYDDAGVAKYWHGFMLDITREKEAERQLRQSEAEFRLLFYKNPLPAWVYDRETLSILEVNEQAIEHYGYSREEFAGMLVTDLVHPGIEPHRREGSSGQAVQRHVVRTGRLIEVEITAYPLTFRERPATLVIAQDVTARIALQAQLSQQAFHDSLTSLPNRVLFRERLNRALAKTSAVAVIFIDLDDFKRINDSLGHSAGDDVLIAIAERLARCIRAGDTIARLGGDEFTVLIDSCTVHDALAFVERIHTTLHDPICIDGREMVISPSIGIALGEEGLGDPEELLRRADVAMYVAKRTGKARHVVFSAEMDVNAVLRLDLESDLRRAIQQNQLELHFQPISRLDTGEIVALEALVRWRHPDHGPIEPAVFIPLAEESGLIITLGTWVLHTACRQIDLWNRNRPDQSPISVHVNISARQFQDQRLVTLVRRALEDSGIAPDQLMLEITESVALNDLTDTRATLLELRELGVHLAIDDFGTGYSGLAYLQHCQIDTIKIDQSYVEGICANPGNEAMVRAVSAYASTLGVDVVAEGVETEEQLAKLREIGIRLGQGFLFSQPLPALAVEARHLTPLLRIA